MIADSVLHNPSSRSYARMHSSIHTNPPLLRKIIRTLASIPTKLAARHAALCSAAALLLASQSATASTLIQDVNTDLSHYSPGVTATIYVDLNNTTGAAQSGNVAINIKHLGILTSSLP